MEETANTAADILSLLYELQQLEFGTKKPTAEQQKRIDEIRARLPMQYLRHYDRLKARGRKGVSIVRNGVCTECRMVLPTGTWNSVRRGDDIAVCENCARYLYYLPEQSSGA